MFGELFDIADDICETLEDFGIDTSVIGDVVDTCDNLFEED
ncbi:hypothetical protein VP14_093 [Vibrio phage VPMCC14]|nr:hypothetical protein VP14_093 [Vibrio phage VPMCC14]